MKSIIEILVAYIPVPHAGYLKFFRAHTGGLLYVLGDEFLQQFPSLVRNLPGVTPEESRKMIQTLGIFNDVRILTLENLDAIWQLRRLCFLNIIMPDENVSHALAARYFIGESITFESIWLRWDWGATQVKRRPEGEQIISVNKLDRQFMHFASDIANHSPDWWRQIGALLVKDGCVLLSAFNRHVPNEQSEYCYGDPRSNFEQGQCIEISSALHAEMEILAEAARRGLKMEGCDLYVTTFPCPPCAYACAYTGIKRLFYVDGYALVAGAETLQAKGVEIIRVEM